MIVFQSNIVQETFAISPETVFGVYAASLVIAVVVIWRMLVHFIKLNQETSKTYSDKLEKIHTTTIEAIISQTEAMNRFNEYIQKKERLYEVVTNHIDRTTQNLKAQESQNEEIKKGLTEQEQRIIKKFEDIARALYHSPPPPGNNVQF